MRIKIITLTLLLSAAALLVQCRTKPATEQGSGVVSKTEVTKTDSTSEDEDSVAVLPNGNEPQAVTVVPQGEPHKGFVYVKNIIPDLIEDLRYFTTNNFMGEKVDGYEANLVILSKEAATALSKAADELREKGYVIEMDDFGSGYSSLNMLSSLPVDVLKMDIAFIRNIERNERDFHLVELILDIARYLKVPVVAEGVETEKQLKRLKEAGCDLVQGY